MLFVVSEISLPINVCLRTSIIDVVGMRDSSSNDFRSSPQQIAEMNNRGHPESTYAPREGEGGRRKAYESVLGGGGRSIP